MTCPRVILPTRPLFIADAVTGEQRQHYLTVQPCPGNDKKPLVKGVFSQHHADGVSAWTSSKHEGKRRVPCNGHPATVVEALQGHYKTLAHLTSYVLRTSDGGLVDKAPRVNKERHGGVSGFDFVKSLGFGVQFDLVAVDVDNNGHVPHTQESIDDYIRQMANRPETEGAIWYFTRCGIRVIFLLDRAVVDGKAFEGYIATARNRVAALGLVVCGLPAVVDQLKDYPRLMALPDILKNGTRIWDFLAQFNVPLIDMSRARGVALEWTEEPGSKSRTRQSAPRRPMPVAQEPMPEDVSMAVPEITVKMLDEAQFNGVQRHEIFLAIPAALLKSGVDPEYVVDLARAIHVRAGFDPSRLEETMAGAVNTVERWRTNEPNKGLAWLLAVAPAIAHAVTIFSIGAKERKARSARSAAPEAQPVEEMMVKFMGDLRDAASPIDPKTGERKARFKGRYAHAAPPGSGKSEAIVKLAVEEAARGELVAIATPTTRNAIDLENRFAKFTPPAPTWRVHSPTSERYGIDGPYVCDYREQALALQAGGHSVRRELCRGRDVPGQACHKAATCPGAADGTGDPKALIHIGPHASAPKLMKRKGPVLLMVDESPTLDTVVEVTVSDLGLVLVELDALYARDYARAMTPVVTALLEWMQAASNGDVDRDMKSILARCGGSDAIEAIDFGKKRQPGEPNFRHTRRPDYLLRIGKASQLLRAIYRAASEESLVKFDDYGGRKVRIVLNSEITAFVATAVRLHIFDADANVRLSLLQSAIRSEIKLLSYDCADGAKVDRHFVYTKGATRKGLLREGKVTPTGDWLALLGEAADRFAERPELTKILVVSYKPLELAMRLAMEPHTRELLSEWVKAGQDEEAIGGIIAAVRPVLDRFPGCKVATLHHGAVTGVDDFKGYSTITLGEDTPNLGAIAATREFRGLDDDEETKTAYLADLKSAATGQGHGRARTSRLKSPIMSIHFGTDVPAGWAGKLSEREGVNPLEAKIAGGAMGKEHGHLGKEHGHLGGSFGHLGAQFGHLGKEHGVKGAEHGVKGGRPKTVSSMPEDEYAAAWKLLKLRGLVEATEMGESSLKSYKNGTVGIPAEVANDIRVAVRERLAIMQVDSTPANDTAKQTG